MFFKKFRKVIAGCILGVGLGMLLIMILPPRVWLCIISIGLIIIGIKKIFQR